MGSKTVQRADQQLTAELAEFIANLSYDDVPEESIRLVERCFVDTVGVTLAGARSGAGAAAARALQTAAEAGGARVLGRGERTTITDAAFVNGAAGHGLDFDDVSSGMSGHPSVTLVPATLAVGESEGASGTDLVAAYVAGFETLCYLAAPITPDHYEAGWHATATLGVFGAAAATASLLRLDVEATGHALNVAASMPAGLKRNFGTMTKPMHAGQAARSGVTAALLARDGYTADEAAIDGDRGFFDLYGATSEPDLDALYPLGERWAVVEDGVGVKKYPCCYFTHSSIEAASGIADEHGIAPEDVESVRVRAARGAGDALHHANPETGLEGKFSMEYAVACAIARDRVGLTAFDDENVDDPAVQSVRRVVDFEVDHELPYGSHEATVTIETADGGTYERTLPDPPGTHDDPLSDEELEEKFVDCATRTVDSATAERAYDRLNTLHEIGRISDTLEGL